MTSALIEDIAGWFRDSPDDIALISEREQLTVRDVVNRISSLARGLRDAKLKPGTLVAVSSDGPTEFIGMCAVQAIGCVSVITPSDSEWRASGAAFLVHDDRDWAPDLSLIAGTTGSRSWNDWLDATPSRDDQVVHGCLTSGTTGQPKLVEFTRQLANQRTIGYIEVWPVRNAVSLFRLSAIAGFGAAIGAMRLRVPYVVFTSLNTRSLDMVSSGSITQLSGAPNQVVQLVQALSARGSTNKFETILTAGAPQTPQFRDVVTPYCSGSIANVYGSTEGGTAAYSTELAATAFSGAPALGTVFHIVDESRDQVPNGVEGEVRYRTPAQCTTYVTNGVRESITDEEGWFYPGDRGRIDEHGFITITGRTGDLVNVGGVKVNPLPIESAIERLDGVEDAACVPVTLENGLTHFVLAVVISRKDAHAAAVALVEAMPHAGRPNLIISVPSIPRNRNGKIDRSELSELLSRAIRVQPGS